LQNTRGKNLILKIAECFLWAILGAVAILVAQAAIAIWLKLIIIILIMAAMVMYCLFTCGMPVKNIDEYSKVSAARQDTVPKPMIQNSSARITREVRPEEKKQQVVVNTNSSIRPLQEQQGKVNIITKRHIKTIVLINEEGKALTEWNLASKAGMVIGKGTDKEPVDIDLTCSAYAQMISKQHAVLNYTGEGWCIDDIDSKNGTRVKKLNRNAILDLKLVGTVELDVGDIIYIANTILQLR
jgi:pSer/pThr/pTyr-binding forkhead associated (FHA) protein